MPRKTTATKIIDIAHPSTVKANASSVPLIVSNRPIMKDPMVVDDTAGDKQSAPPPAKKVTEPIIKKIELKPLGEVHADSEESEKPEKPAAEPKPVVHKSETVIAPLTLTTDETAAQDEAQPAVASEQPADVPATETTAPAPEAPAEASTSETAKEDTEPAAEPATELPDTSLPNDTDTLLPDDKSPDVQAAKAARETAEKQLAVDKLVADGTYILPINAVEKRRLRRTALAVALVLAVVLVAGFLLALDAGYIHVAGLSAPTNFIKS